MKGLAIVSFYQSSWSLLRACSIAVSTLYMVVEEGGDTRTDGKWGTVEMAEFAIEGRQIERRSNDTYA